MIEKRVEILQEVIISRFNVIAHLIGMVLLYYGLLILLMEVPSDVIKSWLGDNKNANWATIFAVILIVLYGSESFYLTFAAGLLMVGLIVLIQYLNDKYDLLTSPTYALLSLLLGVLFFALGHIVQGKLKNIKFDLKNWMALPAWGFNILQKYLPI